MKIFKRKNFNEEQALQELNGIKQLMLFNMDSDDQDNSFIALFDWLSKKNQENILLTKMSVLLKELKSDAVFLNAFQGLFKYLIHSKDFTSLFTEIGVLHSGSLSGEIIRAVSHKILPPLPDKTSMKYLLRSSFDHNSDYKIIELIPNSMWVELFKLGGQNTSIRTSPLINQIIQAINILSYRVMAIAFSKDVANRWRNKTNRNRFQVFIDQHKQASWIVKMLDDGNYAVSEIEEAINQLSLQITECQGIIKDIEANSVLYGTSLEQSYLIAKENQQLIRMKMLIQMLRKEPNIDQVLNASVLIFSKMVTYLNKENNIPFIISNSVGLAAYQVSEHKRETGEKYITASRKDYYSLLKSSILGGLIICVAGLLKAVLHYFDLPTFWAYFFYGLNYAIAFCIMYLTHTTLATKQPAMTAAALAASMDSRFSDTSGAKVSIVIARVWRSQFISFVGNLVAVFPVCVGLAILWQFIFGYHLLSPEIYAQKNLDAQNPLESLCWMYAAVTGVLLYLSGIVSGYFDNKVIFSNIPARIKAHPKLNNFFSKNGVNKISDFFKNHFGSIVGNVFLGMALGFAPFVGEFLGIPFDIRHITISTAFFGFGVVGVDLQLLMWDWIIITIGVLGIGFINFSVSFTLAFITAMKSRNLSLRIVPQMLNSVSRHIMKYPLDFFFPPKNVRSPHDLMK